MKALKKIYYFIKELYNWSELLFWLFGNCVINIMKGDLSDAIDTTYWIRIHLKYNGGLYGKRRLSFRKLLIVKLTTFFGFILISIFLLGIFRFLKIIILN